MRFKQFYIPIYHDYVIIAQGSSIELLINHFEIPLVEDHEWHSVGALTTAILDETGSMYYYILFPSVTTWRDVAHECVHAVNMVFESKGVRLDLKNDEPQAYLMGWMMTRCCETLKNIRKPSVFTDYTVKDKQ